MRNDLLGQIGKKDNITNAVILTHNIDFVFLQSVVLPEMKRCGNPTITIFVDAGCAEETYANQAPVITGLGTRYRVVKVNMKPGFRFHPKAVLLSGKEHAHLWVGSGNLTFGGWRENAEIWQAYSTEKDGTGVFSAFHDYLKNILKLIPLKESINFEIEEAFDKGVKDWAVEMDSPEYLLGRPGNENSSMLDKVRRILGDSRIDEIVLCSPYFDDKGKALSMMEDMFSPDSIKILAQNRRSELSKSVAEKLPPKFKIQPVTFNHDKKDNYSREAFIHAKFYGFIHGAEVTVIAGSANCSNAALTIPGNAGNAELVFYETLSRTEFEERYIHEIELLEGEVILHEREIDKENDESAETELVILAARLDDGLLSIAYRCKEDVEITACLIGEERKKTSTFTKEVVEVQLVDMPEKSVCLEYSLDNKIKISSPIWIDHEEALSTTAHKRSFAKAIGEKVKKDSWTISAFYELLSIFKDNLDYNPKSRIGKKSSSNSSKDDTKPVVYSQVDIYAEDYGLPKPEQIFSDFRHGSSVHSLQQLLYRWLGYIDEEDEGNDGVDNIDEDADGMDEDVERETKEAENYFKKLEEKKKNAPTENQQRKDEKCRKEVKGLIEIIAAKMSDEKFLGERSATKLADDIKISLLLLRCGLLEGWLTSDEFFEFTHRVWIPLFLTSSVDRNKGWIEYRVLNGEEEEFRKALDTAAIKAALIVWAETANDAQTSIEYLRFYLACVQSSAKIPWLWEGSDRESIAKEVASLLKSGKYDKATLERKWSDLEKHWLAIIRRGAALRAVEKALNHLIPGEIKNQVKQLEIKPGELLWQGSDLGICISKETFIRSDDKTVTLLSLRSIEEKNFKALYAIPLKTLLKEFITDGRSGFEIKHRDIMNELLTELNDCSNQIF